MEKVFLVGELRNELTYRSRDAMAPLWAAVFGGELLPEDHEAVPLGKVKKFLEPLLAAKQGRSLSITRAANRIYFDNGGAGESAETAPETLPALLEAGESLKKKGSAGTESKKQTWFASAESWLHNHKLDSAFYINMVVGIYGLVTLFRVMGGAFGLVYALLSSHVMGMVKDRKAQNTAGWGVAAVFIVECFTCMVHTTMFNIYTWQSVRAGMFPFDAVEHPQAPFWIAFALSFGLCGAAFYAVLMTFWLAIEKREAARFEAQHGLEY